MAREQRKQNQVDLTITNNGVEARMLNRKITVFKPYVDKPHYGLVIEKAFTKDELENGGELTEEKVAEVVIQKGRKTKIVIGLTREALEILYEVTGRMLHKEMSDEKRANDKRIREN